MRRVQNSAMIKRFLCRLAALVNDWIGGQRTLHAYDV
jgi:hypothetical protein